MSDYLTQAVVLDKEFYKEIDSRAVLFTKAFGKIKAKIKSGRKITSKLGGHIEPLNRIIVRFIDLPGNGFQVVDALMIGKLSSALMPFLFCLDKVTFEHEPDLKLWNIIKSIPDKRDPLNINLLIKKTLDVTGFNPGLANCHICFSKPSCFLYESANFLCSSCLSHSQIDTNEVVLI